MSHVSIIIFHIDIWHRWVERFPRKRKVGCSNISSDRPKSKRMPHVTVGCLSYRSLTAQWPCVPSVGQNLQPFTDNVSEKFSSRTKIIQTNKQTYQHR